MKKKNKKKTDNKTKVVVRASLSRKKIVPDFQNLYYLVHLKTSGSNNESSSEKSSQSKNVQRIHSKMHTWNFKMELQK